MHEQIGWQAFVERLKAEAPRYAKLLPELPRLVHDALQAQVSRGKDDERRELRALIEEQRRTNRLLRIALWLAAGVAVGVAAWLRWHG